MVALLLRHLLVFGGTLLGILLLVFALERWHADFGFRSADEVAAAMDLRAFALIPDLATGFGVEGGAVEANAHLVILLLMRSDVSICDFEIGVA